MKILITNSDVRKYRQLGKQVNDVNFEGISREIQENELTELLGESLSCDFFNFLDNGFTDQPGTFTRQSTTQFTIIGADLSAWTSDYSLRINNDIFVNVVSAIFGGSDTVVVVSGYDLPTEVTKVEYSSENKYIKLLSGDTYTVSGNTIKYNGLRPFISWKFLAIYTTIGNVKHSDVGNFSIMPENRPNGKDLNADKSISLQNSLREYNRITNYLNENEDIFPLWENKKNENLTNLEMIII